MGLSTLTTLFCHLISYLCFPLAEISYKARKSGWWKPQLSTSWGVSRVEKNEEYMKQWLNIDTVILFCILPINVYVCVRNHAQLFATPLCNCNSPGSSVLGIFQAKILKWVAFPTPGDLSNPGIKPTSLGSPALAGGFCTTMPPSRPRLTWL